MALQNRITPFGDIVATAQRGMFIGNRGIIHDPATRTLLKRRWASQAWIVCRCDYKGVRRAVMGARSWTELFFLDEAVALAAGHRPCFLCRHEAAEAFRAAWARAKRIRPPRAALIDAALHAERLQDGRQRAHPIDRAIRDLPDGAAIASGGAAFVIAGGAPHAWTESGYVAAPPIWRAHTLLTPPSTLAVLEQGYRPVLHPTIAGRLLSI